MIKNKRTKYRNDTMALVIAIAFVITGSCKKENTIPTSLPQAEAYFPKVKTIIHQNCFACHSSTGVFSGRPTEFDTDSQVVSAAASIKASVADPVSPGPFGNRRMPEGSTLPASDVNTIVAWFNKGGKATD